jgi:coenzyme Q-binding protein COQ10
MRTRISRSCAMRARRSWRAVDLTTHQETLELPYRPEDLFDLAAEVERYPEFIMWMQSLKLLSSEFTEDGRRCRAEVSVGFKGFSETFVTDVEARRSMKKIEVSLVRGPFKKLSNTWRFNAEASGSRVEFAIQFEFRNFVLQALADANKRYAVKRVIDCFIAEAGRRYVKVAPPA